MAGGAAGLRAFNRALVQATGNLNRFTRGLGPGGAGGGRPTGDAGLNFLLRRAEWKVYSATETGVSVLASGVNRAFQNFGGADPIGAGARAVTTNALQALNAVGLNLFQIQQNSAAAATVGDITERIARNGGIVDDQLRETAFRVQQGAEQRAYGERQKMQTLLDREYSKGGNTMNDANLSAGDKAVLDVLTKIMHDLETLGRGLRHYFTGGLF